MAHILRRAACSSLVSYLGPQPGDRSFLMVRERPSKTAGGECFTLHGAFDQSASDRLHLSLIGLPASPLPFVLDLCGVSALEEGLLARLLKVQRELAPRRSVSFRIAEDGPVLPLIQRLGLEERFGIEPAKRLPRKRTAVSALVPVVKKTTHDFVVN